jgi:hypothetical protein
MFTELMMMNVFLTFIFRIIRGMNSNGVNKTNNSKNGDPIDPGVGTMKYPSIIPIKPLIIDIMN